MPNIGSKVILPIETIKATAKSLYAGGQIPFRVTVDMKGITLRPITEQQPTVQRYEFFSPTTPIGIQEYEQSKIDFRF